MSFAPVRLPWRRLIIGRLKCKIALSDTDLVTRRARIIQDLIADSLYAVDERMVADAVVARLMVRLTVSEPSFRSECRGPQARSFRRDPLARSFRLSHTPNARRLNHW
jgi:hypothetical protein